MFCKRQQKQQKTRETPTRQQKGSTQPATIPLARLFRGSVPRAYTILPNNGMGIITKPIHGLQKPKATSTPGRRRQPAHRGLPARRDRRATARPPLSTTRYFRPDPGASLGASTGTRGVLPRGTDRG